MQLAGLRQDGYGRMLGVGVRLHDQRRPRLAIVAGRDNRHQVAALQKERETSLQTKLSEPISL